MNRADRDGDKHQQVLYRLQQFRGRLHREQQPFCMATLDQELEGLRLSVMNKGSVAREEFERINQMLSCFRLLMQSELSRTAASD